MSNKKCRKKLDYGSRRTYCVGGGGNFEVRPFEYRTISMCGHSFGQRYQRAADSTDLIVTHQRTPRSSISGVLECVVCADTKILDAFPRLSITSTCTHPPNTCLDCIQLSIESDLSSKLWTEIRCPECTELLEYADIQRYANEQTFSK